MEYTTSNDPSTPILCDGCGEIFANDTEHLTHLSGGFAPFMARIEELRTEPLIHAQGGGFFGALDPRIERPRIEGTR